MVVYTYLVKSRTRGLRWWKWFSNGTQSLLFIISQDGVTPLILASQNGHEEVVRLLLQSGAQDTPDQVTLLNH